MKKITFSILICALCKLTIAQTIEGTVYDVGTGDPVPGVVIYFDGTSILTTTNNDGKFKIVVESIINTTLVFSHLSYEPLIIANPFEFGENEFYLKERVNTLSEVRVVADRYSRADKMKVFREQFLGNTTSGKSCVILNEDDIVLNYDHATNSLTAHSEGPIIIDNRYLAYRISFDLRVLSVDYTENTLNMEKATKVVFKGTCSFTDQNPYNIMYAKRREELYLRSSQCFWKNFTTNTLAAAKFKLYNRLRQVELDRFFLISDLAPQKGVSLIPDTDLNRKHGWVDEASIYGVIGVTYSNKGRSDIVFLTNHFSVDEYGNPDTVDDLLYFGDMGEQRLGDMLPRNFVYTPQEETKRSR